MEGLEPPYLPELSCFTVAVLRRGSLHWAVQAELLVPNARNATWQRFALSMVCLATWNGLPVAPRITPIVDPALFLSGLKTVLFDRGLAGSAPE